MFFPPLNYILHSIFKESLEQFVSMLLHLYENVEGKKNIKITRELIKNILKPA